ncbi:MAG: hypothetical protein H5T84_11580 [Thermoleophilia bacterium]|nr:hypothetical protein [Thermoleophilia bacterium]
MVVFRLNGSGEISDIWELTVGGAAYTESYFDTVSGITYASQDVPRWLVVDKDSKASILTLAPMDSDGREVTGNRFKVDLSRSADPDEKSYVIDYTGSTPKLVDFGNISTGDEVMIFYFCDPGITRAGDRLDRSGGDAEVDMVQIVKIVD